MHSYLSKILIILISLGGCRSTMTDAVSDAPSIIFDDSPGFGRTFDGIGGLSGGGATSKLLVNYPKEQRDQILDYLFTPNFGASLQILKVEIGGDAQSTDGTEASHMHNSWDENYERGYEWWLMKEAKKRNPDIKLYGLPWGFPGWVGQGSRSPYTNPTVTADYVIKWINGAKTQHNLTIDYVGIWNERNYNITYIKTLRGLLDERGFTNVLIVAADGQWTIAKDIKKDAGLANIVHAIGCHYPGTTSSADAVSTGKQLWASEDYSTFNDEVGAGCWARILNQNYVNGLMTATISWNLIGSYYEGLPYYRDGLMTAVQPWSGNYIVQSPIWVSAHTTQFTSIGWKYLNHSSGVGKLPSGGSYVGLVSPDSQQLTIVMETMTHDHSLCIRPRLPKYNVTKQDVIITLKGKFAQISEMNVWYSKLGFGGAQSNMFQKMDPIKFVNGQAKLSLGLDEIYTLTTVKTGQRGSYPEPPPPKAFPLPYKDDFEDVVKTHAESELLLFYQGHEKLAGGLERPSRIIVGYTAFQEPFNLAQQTGAYEIIKVDENQVVRQMVLNGPVAWCQADGGGKSVNVIGYTMYQEPNNLAQQTGAYEIVSLEQNNFIRQMVLEVPVWWCRTDCDTVNRSVSVIGDINRTDIYVEIEFTLPPVNATDGVFVAARVNEGGCQAFLAQGIFFFVFEDYKYILANDLARTKVLSQGNVPPGKGWHKLSLLVKGQTAVGAYDGKAIFNVTIPKDPASGFAAIGTDSYGLADFDNLYLASHEEGQYKMEEYFRKSGTQPLYFIRENH